MSERFEPVRVPQAIALMGMLCPTPVASTGVMVVGDDNDEAVPVWRYDGEREDLASLAFAMGLAGKSRCAFYAMAIDLPREAPSARLQRLADMSLKPICPRDVLAEANKLDAAAWKIYTSDELRSKCPNIRRYAFGDLPSNDASRMQERYFPARLMMELVDVPVVTLVYVTGSDLVSQAVHLVRCCPLMSGAGSAAPGDWNWALAIYDQLVMRMQNLTAFRPEFSSLALADMSSNLPVVDHGMIDTHTPCSVLGELGDRRRWEQALADSAEPLAGIIAEADGWLPMRAAVELCVEDEESWTG